MQPLKSIAPQWEAKDKKLRPVNPYYCESLSSYTCLQLPEASICAGCTAKSIFEETAKLHTFDTDLPDRIYNADELNEVVWQAFSELHDGWYDTMSQPENDPKGFESFAFYMLPAETRQFVTLKQPTQQNAPLSEKAPHNIGDILAIKENMVIVNCSGNGRLVHISKSEPIYGLQFDLSTTIVYIHSSLIL